MELDNLGNYLIAYFIKQIKIQRKNYMSELYGNETIRNHRITYDTHWNFNVLKVLLPYCTRENICVACGQGIACSHILNDYFQNKFIMMSGYVRNLTQMETY